MNFEYKTSENENFTIPKKQEPSELFDESKTEEYASSSYFIENFTDGNARCNESSQVFGHDTLSTNTDTANKINTSFNEIHEQMDNCNSEELQVAIYQFLDGSNIDILNANLKNNQESTEKKSLVPYSKDKEKPYLCGVCGREFAAANGLIIHIRTHTGDQPFICTECNKAFTNGANLRKHMRIHSNERPFKCDICGKTFTLNQNMLSHHLTHSKAKPYNCGLCGKTFTRNYHVKRHMETHMQTPEKNHQCQVCGKTFNRKDGFKSHILTHKKSIFSCIHCDKFFISEARLRYHLKMKHAGEMMAAEAEFVNAENNDNSESSFEADKNLFDNGFMDGDVNHFMIPKSTE